MSRSSVPMPAATADLATTWAFLEDGVDHIMTKLQTGVSFSKVSHASKHHTAPIS
jgi:cullin 1